METITTRLLMRYIFHAQNNLYLRLIEVVLVKQCYTITKRTPRKFSGNIEYFVSFGVITPNDTQNGHLSTYCQKHMQPTVAFKCPNHY